MARSSLFPGYRFHPTDVELVMFYLKGKLMGKKINVNPVAEVINPVAEVNIYDFSPWDLPDKSSSKSGDLEWYFFSPKAKKYSSGGRFNRATETGFWKVTGPGRKVKYNKRIVATIKTLVFHRGHAGKGQRTNWVMHEYGMEDEQLARAGIVQDTYVLCKIFEKSGSGPKNGAQYGAPFNEEEWDDDLAICFDPQAIFGLVGASNPTVHKQKGPATMSITEPGSSVFTFSANEPTNTLNYKQKGPATTNMIEPGSSIVTFSANDPTSTLNYKQKGPATTNMIEPGSSIVSFSANDPTSTLNYKQKGPATVNMIEPGSSIVSFSANEPTSTLNYKQKGPATANMIEPGSSIVSFSANEPTSTLNYKQKGPATVNMIASQATHGSSITEPGSSSVKLSTNEMPVANEDMMFAEDIDLIMGTANGEKVKTMAPNEDDGFYDYLMNMINLDDSKTDGVEYTLDEILRPVDPPDLENFYVD